MGKKNQLKQVHQTLHRSLQLIWVVLDYQLVAAMCYI